MRRPSRRLIERAELLHLAAGERQPRERAKREVFHGDEVQRVRRWRLIVDRRSSSSRRERRATRQHGYEAESWRREHFIEMFSYKIYHSATWQRQWETEKKSGERKHRQKELETGMGAERCRRSRPRPPGAELPAGIDKTIDRNKFFRCRKFINFLKFRFQVVVFHKI